MDTREPIMFKECLITVGNNTWKNITEEDNNPSNFKELMDQKSLVKEKNTERR